jgi:hypothetical protein
VLQAKAAHKNEKHILCPIPLSTGLQFEISE